MNELNIKYRAVKLISNITQVHTRALDRHFCSLIINFLFYIIFGSEGTLSICEQHFLPQKKTFCYKFIESLNLIVIVKFLVSTVSALIWTTPMDPMV